MLKLYGAPLTRSSMIQWYLTELGVPYEFIPLNYQAGHFIEPPADFFAVNPFGKTPAIADGDFTLWESGAILLYLAEKYGERSPFLQQQGRVTQWICFASATLGPVVLVEPSIFFAEQRELTLSRFLAPINEIVSQTEFITGSAFTIADIALTFPLIYIRDLLQIDLANYPDLSRYIQHLVDRPAFQATLGAQMQALMAA